ncbi:MAG: hypothetical protein ACOC5D_05500 [Thermoplasmatota archaeon]
MSGKVTMSDKEMETIKKILKKREKNKLADLLDESILRLDISGTYGGDYSHCQLTTLEIRSPLEKHDKLKNLEKREQEALLDAARQVHPPEEGGEYISDLRFVVDPDLEAPIQEKVLAFCSNCRKTLGEFKNKEELIERITALGQCEKCRTEFEVDSQGQLQKIEWRVIGSKEKFVVELLEEIIEEEKQEIFCYEDKSKDSDGYRYPQKRLNFYHYERTDKASPAVALNFLNKESKKIEKSYCFASPYSLLQVAREALKGVYWLKYEK